MQSILTILITGSHEEEITETKSFLESKFCIKDLGMVNYFLGMEILHEPGGLVVTQRKFSIDLLAEYDNLEHRTVSTPLNPT